MIGHETIDVAAGRFAARRFALLWSPDWPAAGLWVRREDCVFLLLGWSLIADWFELAALHERAPNQTTLEHIAQDKERCGT